ncbi:MAG: hypothetical protein HOJ35_03000 [Bdellovibrionales bacterium]|jgi:hypothetical protein|nr:hypothetical protein [Bdellovibrionales bacterium]
MNIIIKIIFFLLISLSLHAEYTITSVLHQNKDIFVGVKNEQAKSSPILILLNEDSLSRAKQIKIPKTMNGLEIINIVNTNKGVFVVARMQLGDSSPAIFYLLKNNKWKEIGQTSCNDFLLRDLTQKGVSYECFVNLNGMEKINQNIFLYEGLVNKSVNLTDDFYGTTITLSGLSFSWDSISIKSGKKTVLYNAEQLIDLAK